MLGGGHVRRRSVVSSVEASPCIRFEKKAKPSIFHPLPEHDGEYRESSKKPQIIPKPSIASTSSYKFGGERMIKAQRGLLARESLEESCLVADGESLTSRGLDQRLD
jgi:serine/arginine repetitive matrix protein 2